ncbi:MAG: sugar transferase [Planctomycetaceae bacterium]
MTSNLLLEEPPVSESSSELRSAPLTDIVEIFDAELPRTDWLTKLHLDEPRRNLTCLPLATRFTKRVTDIVVASGLLLTLLPVMAVAVILVKLTSPGGIIYSQKRVGLNLRTERRRDRRRHQSGPPWGVAERRTPGPDRRTTCSYGRPFTMYKFRTMRNDAEKHGAQFAKQGDARVTPIGRFLRRTRIDELPQLWNVIKGDMSMVGPRPERPEFMEKLSSQIPRYVDRLGLKPGITGMAQVVNGYDNELDGFRRKVSYDLLYLQNCCLINDLKILFRTVKVVITGEGAL